MALKDRPWYLVGRFLFFIIGFLVISGSLAVSINPLEFVRFQRDRQRTSDLEKLGKLIERLVLQKPETVLAEDKVVYISLPDSDPSCSHWQKDLPTLSQAYRYHCSSNNFYRRLDGFGWLPIQLTALNTELPFSRLPIDPNNGQSGLDSDNNPLIFFYQYIKGSFVLGAFKEAPPNPDEAFHALKKELVLQNTLGTMPAESTAAVGGSMIGVGRISLLEEANVGLKTPSVEKLSNQATKEAMVVVEEVKSKIKAKSSPAQSSPAEKIEIIQEVLADSGIKKVDVTPVFLENVKRVEKNKEIQALEGNPNFSVFIFHCNPNNLEECLK